ncbi:hypothetical protein BDZ91DRAFT_470530 [Kalaharituber pfeilii]|nr:hypothetical protein BDZ91DRAFT_470530 [Kalaharituber pfeilii]
MQPATESGLNMPLGMRTSYTYAIFTPLYVYYTVEEKGIRFYVCCIIYYTIIGLLQHG